MENNFLLVCLKMNFSIQKRQFIPFDFQSIYQKNIFNEFNFSGTLNGVVYRYMLRGAYYHAVSTLLLTFGLRVYIRMYLCFLLSEVILFNGKQYHMGSQSKVQKMFNDSNHTSRQFKIGAFVSSMFGLRRYIKLTREQRKVRKCIFKKQMNRCR